MQPGPRLGPMTYQLFASYKIKAPISSYRLFPLSNGFPPPGAFHGQPRLTMSNFRRLKINHRLPFREKNISLCILKMYGQFIKEVHDSLTKDNLQKSTSSKVYIGSSYLTISSDKEGSNSSHPWF